MRSLSISDDKHAEEFMSVDLSTRSSVGLIQSEAADSDSYTPSGENQPSAHCFGGVFDDFQRRSRHYYSDFADSFTHKTPAAATFMFFATIFSTIALGAHLHESSGGYIGVGEYLLMNAAAGIMFTLTSPQPLMILRPTGPITLILENLAVISSKFNVNFWHLLAFCGYFVGIYLTVIAGLELGRYCRHLTRFTHEIFACYVCSIYVYSGIKGVLGAFVNGDEKSEASVFASALFASVIAVFTLLISSTLSTCTSCSRKDCAWTIFNPGIRSLLCDYSVTIAVVLSTLLSYVPHFYGLSVEVNRVQLPTTSFPPLPTMDPSLVSGRHIWSVDFAENAHDLKKAALIAAAVSIPIAFFFYIDQNLSCILSQPPHVTGMRKGEYMHGPMLIVALCNIIGPSFGLPFVTASLPHSPQLVGALTTVSHDVLPSSTTTPSSASVKIGDSAEHTSQSSVCHENRVAPLCVYLAIGSMAMVPTFTPLIKCIPIGAVRGVLVYVGLSGIASTKLYGRIVALLQEPDFVENVWGQSKVKWIRVHMYTGIQILLLAAFWVVNLSPSPSGLFVAFLVALLGPCRGYLLPSVFSISELAVLDAG